MRLLQSLGELAEQLHEFRVCQVEAPTDRGKVLLATCAAVVECSAQQRLGDVGTDE
jgi:hypothetical protein